MDAKVLKELLSDPLITVSVMVFLKYILLLYFTILISIILHLSYDFEYLDYCLKLLHDSDPMK